MTMKEKKRLNELQAKQKRIQREEAVFWKNVEERKEEIFNYFGVREDYSQDVMMKKEINEIAGMYGITVSELLTYIRSDRQVSYYKKYHVYNSFAAGE